MYFTGNAFERSLDYIAFSCLVYIRVLVSCSTYNWWLIDVSQAILVCV